MLLDTSGLLCLVHRDEAQHDEAQRFYNSAAERLIHNYVLDEFVALANRRGLPRRASLRFSSALLDSPNVEVVWISETLHRHGLDLLNARLDKTYSLCDAVSFLVMRERGLTEALTTDHHFQQEGFVGLLTP